MLRSFASDNNAPIAPEILDAIVRANEGDAVGYGSDLWTARATEAFRTCFGREVEVYFAFNGTGANVAAISCLLKPYEAVLCAATAHLQTDECGAFERFTGCKVLPVATADGKLTPADLEPFVGKDRDAHHVQPRVVSISQATEFGGLYELAELRELCSFAHERGLYVHVDGARLANACASLGLGLRESTRDVGVDVLTFGGTKDGLMFGEAILFFDPTLSAGAAPFAQKQAMQLASKMRYVSAQFEALLQDDRWLRYATHANTMARRLECGIRGVNRVRITRPVKCNAIFATMDRSLIPALQKEHYFYVFDDALPEVRWMTHYATKSEDVDAFAATVRKVCGPAD